MKIIKKHNINSLNNVINRLVRLVGKREVVKILMDFECYIKDWPKRKDRLNECKTLIVAHKDDLDGG